jgi:hypothetical protein
VEIDVLMPEEAPLRRCHDVAETLQYCLEGLKEVDRAFVTIDCRFQIPIPNVESANVVQTPLKGLLAMPYLMESSRTDGYRAKEVGIA